MRQRKRRINNNLYHIYNQLKIDTADHIKKTTVGKVTKREWLKRGEKKNISVKLPEYKKMI